MHAGLGTCSRHEGRRGCWLGQQGHSCMHCSSLATPFNTHMQVGREYGLGQQSQSKSQSARPGRPSPCFRLSLCRQCALTCVLLRISIRHQRAPCGGEERRDISGAWAAARWWECVCVCDCCSKNVPAACGVALLGHEAMGLLLGIDQAKSRLEKRCVAAMLFLPRSFAHREHAHTAAAAHPTTVAHPTTSQHPTPPAMAASKPAACVLACLVFLLACMPLVSAAHPSSTC